MNHYWLHFEHGFHNLLKKIIYLELAKNLVHDALVVQPCMKNKLKASGVIDFLLLVAKLEIWRSVGLIKGDEVIFVG